MGKKLKLYFDTSVFNFAFADDTPDKKTITLKLIDDVKTNKYDVYISVVVLKGDTRSATGKGKEVDEFDK